MVFDDGDGFHEVCNGDDVARYCDVDGSCGGAVGGFLDEERFAGGLVFERVDYDLQRRSASATQQLWI